MVTRRHMSIVVCTALTFAAVARGGTIWQWTHEASGEGTANVFDGGTPVFAAGGTLAPGDASMAFGATDATRFGTLGGRYITSGESRVSIIDDDDAFEVFVDFNTEYLADSGPNADRPGGEGEGWLNSVIEFVMPVDELAWERDLRIRDASFISGTTRVVVENLTRSTTLIDLVDEEFSLVTLSGQAGDVIRITTDMSGNGRVPAGISGFYDYGPRLLMRFFIPEPATAVMLGLGAILMFRRRRQTK